MRIFFWFVLVLLAICLYFCADCGYSEQEMQLARSRQQLTESQLEQCYEGYPEADDADAGR